MYDVVMNNRIIIENLIYDIKDKQVILDTDLAFLYKTRQKELMKRFIETKKNFQKDFVLE